jgi:outer membrane usher protein
MTILRFSPIGPMLCLLCLTSISVASFAAGSAPTVDEFEFDQKMLWGSKQDKAAADLSKFSRGNPVSPGDHDIQLYVNESFYQGATVHFVDSGDANAATPCFSRVQIQGLGLALDKLSPADQLWVKGDRGTECVLIQRLVADATTRFDFTEQRLDVYVPQAFLVFRSIDYIDPALWDDGINAGRLNYNLNLFNSDFGGQNQTLGFLQLESGFNLNSWRLRNISALNKNETGVDFQAQRTFAQTDIAEVNSTLTIGDSYTDGQLFDSHGVRGVFLGTDDRMLPASQRGYAPVVRGTANTNAKVTITQGGVVLYQQAVSPGPFEITDLMSIGYGRDLEVTVTEADGAKKIFTVPYSPTAQLLRPGYVRVASAIGQAWSPSLDYYKPMVAQTTVQYGLSNALTVFGGALGSEDYFSSDVGGAISTPFGGLSADITLAQNKLKNVKDGSGGSLRVVYSNYLEPTKTNITLSSYRYSTSGFWSFSDMVQTEDARQSGYDDIFDSRLSFSDRQKGRFDINLQQGLKDDWGRVSISGTTRNYWNREGSDTQYQLTYSNRYKELNYDISATRIYDQYDRIDNEIRVSFTVPLSISNGMSRQYVSGRAWSGSATGSQSQLELSGVAGAHQQYAYSASASQDLDNTSAGSYGLNGSYQGPYAQVSGGVTQGNDYRQTTLGVAGGIVAHGGGVTFGQPLGETVALIEAKDAGGANILNAFGAGIDNHGYGLAPYLSPYIRNRVEIDPEGLSSDLMLETSSAETIPAAGSIVLVRFETSKENSILIKTKFSDGSPLPFGAEIVDNRNGSTVGYVGQAGHAFVRNIEPTGRLTVKLANDSSCEINYDLKVSQQDVTPSDDIKTVGGVCLSTSQG